MKFVKLGTKHQVLPSNDEQRSNLLKLAHHLAALENTYSHFHMGFYFLAQADDTVADWRLREGIDEDGLDNMFEVKVQENSFEARIGQCGAVACAIGHGPLAGIPESSDDCDWDDYAVRVFGVDASRSGSFLFGCEWTQTANTAHEAAERIFYALEHGVPCEGDYFHLDYFHEEVVRV
jgi:hypothetical protein